MEFTIRQRADLRWVYQIDGKDSDQTWATAGEAERGATAAMRKGKPGTAGWQMGMVWGLACVPVLWILVYVVRLIMQ